MSSNNARPSTCSISSALTLGSVSPASWSITLNTWFISATSTCQENHANSQLLQDQPDARSRVLFWRPFAGWKYSHSLQISPTWRWGEARHLPGYNDVDSFNFKIFLSKSDLRINFRNANKSIIIYFLLSVRNRFDIHLCVRLPSKRVPPVGLVLWITLLQKSTYFLFNLFSLGSLALSQVYMNYHFQWEISSQQITRQRLAAS